MSETTYNLRRIFKSAITSQNVIKELSQLDDIIIDCGGGVVLDPENISHLKKNGFVIYLATSPEVVYNRTKDEGHRPLLLVDDPMVKIKELLNKRQSFYEQAGFTVNTDERSVDEVCEEIISIVRGDVE